MAESLKNKAINATKWSMYGQLGQYLLNFVLSIILARILAPEDFGLVGMITIFISLSTILVSSGLSVALVRATEVSKEDLSTMFVFNMFVSVLLYLILFFCAPLISQFYNEPTLIPLVRLFSLVFVINATGIVQNTILLRKVELKKQTFCYLTGMTLSVIVASYMAFNGYGVYSIVGQSLSQAIGTNVMLWINTKWSPLIKFSRVSFKRQWNMGSKILSTNLISSAIDNIDNVLIGRFFSVTDLGFFVRAKSTKQIPESIFWGTINTSSFAILSKLKDNMVDFKKMHLNYYNFGIYLYLPVIAGIYFLAAPLVEILYSDKWLPAVPILQILCIGSVPMFIDGLFIQTYMALGEVNLYMKITSIKKIISLFAIPIGIYFGIVPFVWAIVFFQYFGLIINIIFVRKMLNSYYLDYIRRITLPVLGVLSMVFGLHYLIKFIPIESNVLLILFSSLAGGLWYLLFSLILKLEQYENLKNIVVDYLKGKYGKKNY